MNSSIYLMRSVFFSLLVAPWDLPESISMFYCSNAHQVHICVCVCLLPFPATQNCSHSDGLGLPYTGFPQAAPWICTPAEQSKPRAVFLLWLQLLPFQFTTQVAFLSWIFSSWGICVPPRAAGLRSGNGGDEAAGITLLPPKLFSFHPCSHLSTLPGNTYFLFI